METDWGAIHSLTVDLHSALFLLAFACIVITLLCQLVIYFGESMPKSLVHCSRRTRGYTDAAAFAAILIGIVTIFISAFTGSESESSEVLLNDPILRNKIMLTVFALVTWMGVAGFRAKFGRKLWTNPFMSGSYTLLAIIGMTFIGSTGSLGAQIVQGESVLDFFWKLLPFDITQDLFLTLDWSLAIGLGGLLVIVFGLLIVRMSGIAEEEYRAKSSTSWSKWEEPVIGETEEGGP
jgi:hypothetical protein